MRTIIIVIVALITLWKISKYFPCPSWLGWIVEAENPFAKENRSSSIIKHLNLTSNMIVADIGCGPGRVTIPLSKKLTSPGKIVAIDLQQGMLDRLTAKANKLENIELRKQDINKKPLEENYYDRILLVNVIGEIPDQEKTVENIFAALKIDGSISLTETIFDPHFQSKQKLTKLLQKYNFKNLKTFGPWYSYTIHGTK